MFKCRYHVLVYNSHEFVPFVDTYFATINQVVKFADVFDLTKVSIECIDDVFENEVDIVELLNVWRSR